MPAEASGETGRVFEHHLVFEHHQGRSGSGDVEEKWTELKKTLVDAAEQHLHQSRQSQKNWILAETLRLTREAVGLCKVTEPVHLCREAEALCGSVLASECRHLRGTKRSGGIQIWQRLRRT